MGYELVYQCVWATTVHKAIAFVKAFLHFCTAITVQFEQDTYMADESDGMVDVRVAASGRTSFEYTFTVTPMDLTATGKFDSAFSEQMLDRDYNSVSTKGGMVTAYCEVVTYSRTLTATLNFCADNIDYTFPPTPYTFGPTTDNEPIPSLVIPIPINDDNNNERNEM